MQDTWCLCKVYDAISGFTQNEFKFKIHEKNDNDGIQDSCKNLVWDYIRMQFWDSSKMRQMRDSDTQSNI